MQKNKMQIGVFDSGLGGLSILKEFISLLPKYNYVYLGDNARVPYGGRSSEIIYQYTTEALRYLFSKNCKLVILACNTATSTSLKKIQTEFLPRYFPDRKVLGIIKPVIEILPLDGVKKIGVIATRATVASKSFIREIKKVLPTTKIIQQETPLLVPFIEEGEIHWPGLSLLLKKYLAKFKKQRINQLVLGCTHYGLIHSQIQQELGKTIKVLSEGKIAAIKLKDYLEKHPEVETVLGEEKSRHYLITDLTPRYQKLFSYFLGKHFKKTDQLFLVSLD